MEYYDDDATQPDSKTISRINVGGGYFLTKNTLVKLEYVSQNYDDAFTGHLQDANFSGIVMEAVIGF
ncbi:MAG: hypothetical protein U5L09_13600 [Bacteroidales bacterium]|nr:hypothetical protein [Bacteroidales bacterium]